MRFSETVRLNGERFSNELVTGSNLVNPDSVDLTLIPLLFNGELALHITFFFQKLSPYQSKLAEDN